MKHKNIRGEKKMKIRSISNLELLKFIDESNDNIYFGCDQEWYPTEWQKKAGCGPTTACNILLYLKFLKFGEKTAIRNSSKEFALSQMQEAWSYITPTENGIPTTGIFCQAIIDYYKSKDLSLTCCSFDIPKDKCLRPGFEDVIHFIEDALLADSPVAFLNLCNGDVLDLDSWHWVSIVSLEFNEDGSAGIVEIVDEGIIKKIDLYSWYNTTKLGGGLVYITLQKNCS